MRLNFSWLRSNEAWYYNTDPRWQLVLYSLPRLKLLQSESKRMRTLNSSPRFRWATSLCVVVATTSPTIKSHAQIEMRRVWKSVGKECFDKLWIERQAETKIARLVKFVQAYQTLYHGQQSLLIKLSTVAQTPGSGLEIRRDRYLHLCFLFNFASKSVRLSRSFQ